MSSAFGLGYKALKSLCASGTTTDWYRYKLEPDMFKPGEVQAFEFVQAHVHKHKQLPHVDTLGQAIPETQAYQVPEPSSYYLEHLENRFYYELINSANIASQQALKDNPQQPNVAKTILNDCTNRITRHQYRTKIVSLSKDGPAMVLAAYHSSVAHDSLGVFGWPYLDSMTGGMMAGDFVSIIGRPAAGKTWLVLYHALQNWLKGKTVLVVSMEMSPLAILQRMVTMYSHTNISQLKLGGYSSSTYKTFISSCLALTDVPNPLYVVDGNLAVSVDETFVLAEQLKVDIVDIDGAYLMKHQNPRLDRYTRVAENAELIKQCASSTGKPTTASYQFARSAVKDKKNKKDVGLEDIGYTDVIGQVSSVALGLFQDESVETIEGRQVRILKGRNGEVGQFEIAWDFENMEFGQKAVQDDQQTGQLEYI